MRGVRTGQTRLNPHLCVHIFGLMSMASWKYRCPNTEPIDCTGNIPIMLLEMLTWCTGWIWPFLIYIASADMK